jgi:hypothetical protein
LLVLFNIVTFKFKLELEFVTFNIVHIQSNLN